MLRKTLLLLGLCALSSVSVQAQDKVELFGGFSYMHSHSSNLTGWEISGQYKLRDWLGAVADVDGHYGSVNGTGSSKYAYPFATQLSLPSTISRFGPLLSR